MAMEASQVKANPTRLFLSIRTDNAATATSANGVWCTSAPAYLRRWSCSLARDGGWAEFVAVPANQVHRMPKDLPVSTGILVEPISCVLHGYDRLFTAGAAKQLDPTDSVLILGAGIIGLLWACLLHQRGYRTIHISDISPERRQAVENLKLDGVLPRQPTELLSNTYQLIVDCTGVPKALESAYKSLSSGGILCVFGCAPEGVKLNLPYYDLVNREITVVFCRVNQFASDRAIDLTYQLHRQGYLDFNRLGIQVYPLDQHQKAFETLGKRQAPKVAFQLD
ncbi:hypothetical protein BOX15_Mlig009135g3 [Macrostomum lignano]|uniref:Glucose dehydrogenase C-terminal domain-containing protein n=1 Tax=Macrostomum lignano TaxID=282301 RepID=A0A267E4T5_9PLAT|nr:hypothetical protein BOX15_Mlig009135g3 [Macrostomum lignano]